MASKKLIKCSAKTCIHYKKGTCTTNVLKIENLEYQDSNDDPHDEMICRTYECIANHYILNEGVK